MSDDVNIRDAVEADLPAILEIYNDVILHTTAVYDYEAHTLEMRQKWFHDRRHDGFPVVVSTNDGEITGFGSFGFFRPWQAYRFSVEHSLYVRKDKRGTGISKHILSNLISGAKKMDKHIMIAGIDAENIASIRLHEQFGFVKSAHLKQVGYKFDRWLDLVFYQLMLK